MAALLVENLTSAVRHHIIDIGEDIIRSEIEDVIPDFLVSDWEERFDDEYEAYAKMGSREAELQVFREHASDALGMDANDGEIEAFVYEMAKQLCVSLN